MNIADNTNNDKDGKNAKVSDERVKYTPKKYPRAWEIELTEEQRENLRKSIEEDEKKYKEIGKKLAEDREHFKLWLYMCFGVFLVKMVVSKDFSNVLPLFLML